MKRAGMKQPIPIRPASPEEVVVGDIVFEIGDDRFAIDWSAEIRSLPPEPAAVVPIAKRKRKHT